MTFDLYIYNMILLVNGHPESRQTVKLFAGKVVYECKEKGLLIKTAAPAFLKSARKSLPPQR
jgi:ribosome-associated protein YbcJ (S4-like RNA binding protein)